jgi:ribosome maturation factor RimP
MSILQQRVERSTLFYYGERVLHDIALESNIREEIGPVLEGVGFSLVELKVGRSHKLVRVTVVVYRREGVGVNDLSTLSRMIKPRLDLLEELGDFTLVFASPGINREIKHSCEYSIFKDRGIRVLLKDEVEWMGGIIKDSDGKSLYLQTSKGLEKIELEAIRKAKLDYNQESGSVEHVL